MQLPGCEPVQPRPGCPAILLDIFWTQSAPIMSGSVASGANRQLPTLRACKTISTPFRLVLLGANRPDTPCTG